MAKTNPQQKDVKPSADGIAQAATAAIRGKGPAPVHLWNPPFCGDLDIRIARDGTWFYMGSPIGREALVRLFSSVLKREGDRHYLVTPAEKVGIIVDDAPFLVTDLRQDGGRVVFLTRTGEEIAPSDAHPLRVERIATDPAPYIHVRGGMEALIDRKTFYRLVDLCAVEDGMFGFRSDGAFFPLAPADAVEADDTAQ